MTPIKIINSLAKYSRRGGTQSEATLAYHTMQKANEVTFGENVNSNNIVMLSLLHNINNIKDITPSTLNYCTNQLNTELKNKLELFTINEGESSSDVFERIKYCLDLEVLYVYLASCYINSEYTIEEASWYNKTTGQTYNKERIKWLTRAGKIIEAINELS